MSMTSGGAPGRREGLLRLARRSRLKWLLDAREQSHSRSAATVATSSSSSQQHQQQQQQQQPKIPAADSIQDVLRLLADLAADDEVVDLDSLINSLPDDMGELLADEDGCGDGGWAHPNSNPSLGLGDYCRELNADGDRTSYGVFLEKLRHYEATEIVKSMQQFVAKFEIHVKTAAYGGAGADAREPLLSFTNGTIDMSESNKADTIWAFLDYITSEMRSNVLWSPEHESTDRFDNTKSACERFVFVKLHKHLFGAEMEDVVANRKMAERLRSLAFLSAEHLDIRALAGRDDAILSDSIATLLTLNSFCSPAEKIDVIKRCSVCIAAVLSSLKTSGSQPGADEYLPLLILVIAKANPPDLYSNVAYLQKYVHPSKYVSEAGYLLTNFVSAVHFLENVDANALTISPDEFDSALQRCRVELYVSGSRGGNSSSGSSNFFFNRKGNNNNNSNNSSSTDDDDVAVEDAATVERLLLQSNPHLRQLDIREVRRKRQHGYAPNST